LKIVLAGDWHSDLHEEAVRAALATLGHEVVPFAWHRYFHPGIRWPRIDGLLKRAQNKYLFGPQMRALNADLLAVVGRERPQLVLVYRGTHVYPDTLRRMRAAAPESLLIGYNNDDPFAANHFPRLFKHFLQGVPEYDAVFAYRHRNLEEYLAAGARRVGLLRSWFIPERNHPIELDAEARRRYECDVAFAGHFEDDGRAEYLEAIVRRGFNLRLYGPEWGRATESSAILSRLAPVHAVRGEEYNKALSGCKIALCFLSKLNRDTYTRRCFEIPATRTLMLSEYSDDLASLYEPGVEAEFFRSKDDMLRTIERYLTDDTRRRAVAEAGWRRVHADGHDVLTRMKRFLAEIEEIGAAR
jgi:spore maturation protein CgeB